MVNYLPSQVTRTITITSLDVATTLTISAPASSPQGQPFMIEGQLKRADTEALLEGENIVLSYNGTPLGTTQTRPLEGTIKYQAIVQIDVEGTFTLTADFAGSTRPGLTLGPSSAFTRIGLAEPSILPLLLIGIAAYVVLKKG